MKNGIVHGKRTLRKVHPVLRYACTDWCYGFFCTWTRNRLTAQIPNADDVTQFKSKSFCVNTPLQGEVRTDVQCLPIFGKLCFDLRRIAMLERTKLGVNSISMPQKLLRHDVPYMERVTPSTTDTSMPSTPMVIPTFGWTGAIFHL